ncbi:MAG TPA: DUF1015 family protein [Thermoanaerobaculia bacterium]
MATMRPFRALRPPPDRAADVSAVPYDVVSTDEARSLAAGNPLSFLHVSRPEIDLPDGIDPHADAVYELAAKNFARLRREAPLALDPAPTLSIYRLRMGDHVQTGVAGCSSLAEYDADVVRKHERTRRDKEDDRTRHMLGLSAQTGPVFLTYRDRHEVDALVAEAVASAPLADFTAPDGVSHTLWRLTPKSSARLAKAFEAVPLLYIADGHHRAASAARARDARRSANPAHTGAEDYNFFLTVAFPAGQVRILPYNRLVKDLNGRSPDAFRAELARLSPLRDAASGTPARKGDVGVYLGGRWSMFALPAAPAGAAAIESLDAERLQKRVLDPLLGIRDVRTDKRLDFVGGIRGTEALERAVSSGRAAAAFSMFPVSLAELMAVSDANEIMPPKSTWFEPKLRDGLLIHEM